MENCNKKLAQYHSHRLHQSLFPMTVSDFKLNSKKTPKISYFAHQCQRINIHARHNFLKRKYLVYIFPNNDQRFSLTWSLKRPVCDSFYISKCCSNFSQTRLKHCAVFHTISSFYSPSQHL